MPINSDFSQNANPQDSSRERLGLFEADLRNRFRDKLSAVIAAQSVAAEADTVDLDHARHLAILKDLSSTFTPGSRANIYFDREKALPVSAEHGTHGFQESLVRLRTENGGAVSPKDLFGALEDKRFGTDLATSFRLWLIFASIMEFHQFPRTMGLSVNIVPHDLDSAEFRETLDRGLALFSACRLSPLILEATEYDPWMRQRRLALQEMVRKHDLTLAIDDYGASNGYNHAKSLSFFARDMPPGSLIVKLDGQVVIDFLQYQNEDLIARLQEISELCGNPVVVAEWMPSIEDIRVLQERLRPYGLDHLIGLVQSTYLQKETPDSLLRKLDILDQDAGNRPQGP